MIDNIAVIYRFPFLFHHLRIGKGEFIKRVGFSFYGVAYLFPALQKRNGIRKHGDEEKFIAVLGIGDNRNRKFTRQCGIG